MPLLASGGAQHPLTTSLQSQPGVFTLPLLLCGSIPPSFDLFIFVHSRVFVAVFGLSLVLASGGYSSCGIWASHSGGFSPAVHWF